MRPFWLIKYYITPDLVPRLFPASAKEGMGTRPFWLIKYYITPDLVPRLFPARRHENEAILFKSDSLQLTLYNCQQVLYFLSVS